MSDALCLLAYRRALLDSLEHAGRLAAAARRGDGQGCLAVLDAFRSAVRRLDGPDEAAGRRLFLEAFAKSGRTTSDVLIAEGVARRLMVTLQDCPSDPAKAAAFLRDLPLHVEGMADEEDRAEGEWGKLSLPGEGGSPDEMARAAHSDDFACVRWFGVDYTFTATQARCVRVLFEAWESGMPVLSEQAILEAAGSAGSRLRDVFKGRKGVHPAWGTLIVRAGKGRFRLGEPAPPRKPRENPA